MACQLCLHASIGGNNGRENERIMPVTWFCPATQDRW